MSVSDQTLYRDWELLRRCDLDLDRLASLHGVKLPSTSGADLAELRTECAEFGVKVRAQEPEETDKKYAGVVKGELAKARSLAIEAVIQGIAESKSRLRELDAALRNIHGEQDADRASRVRMTWVKFQVGKLPHEWSEQERSDYAGRPVEELRSDLQEDRPTLSAKAELPESWAQLQERLWLDGGAWKHRDEASRGETPRDIETMVSQYPRDERWPRISRRIDWELTSNKVLIRDARRIEDLKSEVSDRLFLTCLSNADSWRREGMELHQLKNEYWGKVEKSLKGKFGSAVKSIQKHWGEGGTQEDDESNSLASIEPEAASQEASAFLNTDKLDELLNKVAPPKPVVRKKRTPQGAKMSSKGTNELTEDESRVIEQLKKSDDRQGNAEALGMKLNYYDQKKCSALKKLKAQAKQLDRRQD